jgi:hypothetical protein
MRKLRNFTVTWKFPQASRTDPIFFCMISAKTRTLLSVTCSGVENTGKILLDSFYNCLDFIPVFYVTPPVLEKPDFYSRGSADIGVFISSPHRIPME